MEARQEPTLVRSPSDSIGSESLHREPLDATRPAIVKMHGRRDRIRQPNESLITVRMTKLDPDVGGCDVEVFEVFDYLWILHALTDGTSDSHVIAARQRPSRRNAGAGGLARVDVAGGLWD